MVRYEKRKSSKKTSHAYRFECMSTKDLRRLKTIKRTMVTLTLLIARLMGDVTRNMRLLAVYSREYFRMQYKRKRHSISLLIL